MVAHKAIPDFARTDSLMLATDLDTDMLNKGRTGIYEASSLKDIPADYQKGQGAPMIDGQKMVMTDSLKNWIRFKQLNFLHEWPIHKQFDIIFCRNALIYFDRATQDSILTRFAALLKKGGWLYLGHSETIRGLEKEFRLIGHTIYERI
jgi:chemotaxis protein methyltransferase CheR